MIFNQPAYFALLIGSVAVFRLLPAAARPWWLFATGVTFYAHYSPGFVVVLLIEVVLVFALAQAARTQGRIGALALSAGLGIVVAALVAYKYGDLLMKTASAAGAHGLPSFEDLRLPLAISFFTFEFVHYLVDARRRTLPEHSVSDFLAFAMFVPTMVAGPIKRFQGFSQQVREARVSAHDADAGVRRIVMGLAKKLVVADTMTLWIGPLASSSALADASRADIVVALIAYSVRIYMDFSGYSDIAIGSARLFGIRVPENFSWPYLKTNIADFWRSWHRSLSSWITDYVYIPLGGNRCRVGRQCANILAAMAVSGIWHGAAWNFLGWGLYHGVLLSIHRLWRIALTRWGPVSGSGPVGGEGGDADRARDGAVRVGGFAHRFVSGGVALASGALTFSLVTLGWGLFAMPFSRFLAMLAKIVGA